MGRLRRRVRWQNFFGTSATCRSWLVGLYCRDFRCLAGNWEKAHGLLKNNPNLAELAEQLVSYGKKLEDAGRIKEAEKLYLTLDKADLAINMYKNFQRYDEVSLRSEYWSLIFFDFVKKRVPIFFQMMSLVSKYHGDLVSTTHVHLAHECESLGNYRAAENHYVQAGEWKLAVKMYRSLDMWEEAYKACARNQIFDIYLE